MYFGCTVTMATRVDVIISSSVYKPTQAGCGYVVSREKQWHRSTAQFGPQSPTDEEYIINARNIRFRDPV